MNPAFFSVLSDLMVNLAAGWFALVFIEPQISGLSKEIILPLIFRLVAGIVCLAIAKKFREEAKIV